MPQWPSGCETPQIIRSNSTPQRGGRSKSTVGSSQRQKQRARPASATNLLRGEGLVAWKPYEDRFRRGIENTQVKDTKDTMKRERFLHRGVIADIDVMADPILFDLKVLHNGAQRARSAALGNRPGTAPPGMAGNSSTPSRRNKRGDNALQNSAKSDNPSIAEVKDLCKTLNGDIAQHCGRMHMPIKCVEDKNLKHVVTKIQQMRGTLHMPQKDNATDEDPALGFRKELKALFGNTNKAVKRSFLGGGNTDQILEKLAKFLLSTGGSMRPTLEAIDCDGNGKFKCPDWCVGLELLGWSGDAEVAWNMLDFHNRGELELKVIEERLVPHLPPPPDED